MLFSSSVTIAVMVRIRFSVWLVNGYAHVFILLSVGLSFSIAMMDVDHSECRENVSVLFKLKGTTCSLPLLLDVKKWDSFIKILTNSI